MNTARFTIETGNSEQVVILVLSKYSLTHLETDMNEHEPASMIWELVLLIDIVAGTSLTEPSNCALLFCWGPGASYQVKYIRLFNLGIRQYIDI